MFRFEVELVHGQLWGQGMSPVAQVTPDNILWLWPEGTGVVCTLHALGSPLGAGAGPPAHQTCSVPSMWAAGSEEQCCLWAFRSFVTGLSYTPRPVLFLEGERTTCSPELLSPAAFTQDPGEWTVLALAFIAALNSVRLGE